MKRHENDFLRQEVKEITFYIFFGIFMSVLIPLALGFSFRGFEQSFVAGQPLKFGTFLTTFLIYYIWIFVGLIALPVLKIREMFLTKENDPIVTEKQNIFQICYLHDPEKDSALWAMFRALGFKDEKNPMRWSLSMTRMFIIGTIVFSLVGLFATFTSIPQLTFQITPVMEVLFTAEPASFAETTLMIFILSILLGFDGYFSSKFKDKNTRLITYFLIAVMIIPLIIAGLWGSIHLVVYGNSEVKLFQTAVFGWAGSLLTVLTGSFIWWYCFHFFNNIFAKIGELFPQNEDVIFISLSCIILLLVIWITAELAIAKYKRKRRGINQ